MTRRAATRRGTLCALLVLVSLAAAACGGAAPTASSSSALPATSLSPEMAGARSRFVECLETHGVPAEVASWGFGDLLPRAGSPSPTTPMTVKAANQYRGAFETCRGQLPTRGLGGMRGADFLNSPAGRAYVSCLQDHGMTLPASTAAPSGAAGTSPRASDFKTAEKACAGLTPRVVPGTSTSLTTAP